MKKDVIATVNGVPLDEVLCDEENAEIREHVRNERANLVKAIRPRRARSPRRLGMGHHGKSGQGYSVLLMRDLEPYVSDADLTDKGIADLFRIRLTEIRQVPALNHSSPGTEPHAEVSF